MKRPKVHPDCKTNYKIRNWASYDRALVRRGDLTICLSPRAVTTWTAMPSGKSGGQRYDSDIAIEAALTVRLVFGLPWRQAEGLLNVMLTFKDLELRSPDHTTLSRRCRALDVVILVEPGRRITPCDLGGDRVAGVRAWRVGFREAGGWAQGSGLAQVPPGCGCQGEHLGRQTDRLRGLGRLCVNRRGSKIGFTGTKEHWGGR